METPEGARNPARASHRRRARWCAVGAALAIVTLAGAGCTDDDADDRGIVTTTLFGQSGFTDTTTGGPGSGGVGSGDGQGETSPTSG
jgi:hypothetical protein